ncbi:MAG: DUF433 domain-containing protein [Acidobacteria bacterium]|nr:DUF433 domain-containing protein [Acidobacteriota bacterium]
MTKEYVIKTDGAYRITDSRVSLDSVVYAWRDGASPETIREMFPVLTLEEVYGAVAFYLANQEEIDKYLLQTQAEYEIKRRESTENLRRTKPDLYRRLMAAKEQKVKAATSVELVHQ